MCSKKEASGKEQSEGGAETGRKWEPDMGVLVGEDEAFTLRDIRARGGSKERAALGDLGSRNLSCRVEHHRDGNECGDKEALQEITAKTKASNGGGLERSQPGEMMPNRQTPPSEVGLRSRSRRAGEQAGVQPGQVIARGRRARKQPD